MKFTVSMKDPDTLHEAIADAVNTELAGSWLDYDEQGLLADSRKEKINKLCSKWFRYGEYLDVEIDTEAGTCTVKESK